MEEWQLMKAKGMAHSEKLPLCNHYCNKLFRLKSQFGSKKKTTHNVTSWQITGHTNSQCHFIDYSLIRRETGEPRWWNLMDAPRHQTEPHEEWDTVYLLPEALRRKQHHLRGTQTIQPRIWAWIWGPGNNQSVNLRDDLWYNWSAAAAAKSLQSCPTLCNPIDVSPPGSPVPGILQARTLEWVAISFSNA